MNYVSDNDTPVFDRRDQLPELSADADTADWQPARTRLRMAGASIILPNDGMTVEDRLARQAVWSSSQRYSGQHANDNADWPLKKLLNTESNMHCLALAERYRHLHDLAESDIQLFGKDASENVYLVQDGKIDDATGNVVSKGVKVLTGKKAIVETEPTQKAAIARPSVTRRLASPVARKWNGDDVIIGRIDAKLELAMIRSKLAVTTNIIAAFEMSVVAGMTFEAIGLELGAGSKGARGSARAWVFDGFQIADRFWRSVRMAA